MRSGIKSSAEVRNSQEGALSSDRNERPIKPSVTFCCFNPIPWPHILRRPSKWPFPNRLFDPVKAIDYYRAQIEQMVFAEECGFDWVGVGEDHMTAWGLTPNPALILSILATRTKRVKLAILGAPLPLLNPIRVAEECAMLDVLSGGRLVAGFIRGVPQNYRAYGVDPDQSRERFSEAATLIIKAWTEREIFSWREKYYHFPAVSIWPLPVQKPHPPLIFSANSVDSAVVGARYRAMIGSIHLYNRDAIEQVEKAFRAYREEAREARWKPGADRFLIGLQTCVSDSDGQAQKLLEPALAYHFHKLSGLYDKEKILVSKNTKYGHSPVELRPPEISERIEKGLVLCGSPATVTSQIRDLQARLGVGVISMHFQVGDMADADVRRGMELFRDHVLPSFRTMRSDNGG